MAIRGQINDNNFDKAVGEAQKYLDEAKKIDGQRGESYYNEAILTHEFRAKRAGEKAVPVLEKAAEQYRDFVNKAGDEPVFAQAVKRSKERIQDIEDTIKFLRDGEQAKKDAEEAEKEAKRQAEEAKKEADAAKKQAEEDAKAGKAVPGAPADGAKPGDVGKPADPKAGGDAKAPADKGAKPAPKK